VANRRETTLRDEGLAFFGRVVSGQSHEIVNVLNVINELAGLQLDLVRQAAGGGQVRLERLHTIAEKIQQQVQRGELIVRSVNRFAHSVDLPVALLDLRELVSSVVFLAGRTARLNRVDVTAELPVETLAVESNPFLLSQMLCACVDVAVATATTERRVTLSYRVLDRAAELAVGSADPVLAPAREQLEVVHDLVEELGGRVLAAPGQGGGDRFVVLVPQHHPGAGVGNAAPG